MLWLYDRWKTTLNARNPASSLWRNVCHLCWPMTYKYNIRPMHTCSNSSCVSPRKHLGMSIEVSLQVVWYICCPDAQRMLSKHHSEQTHQSANNDVMDIVLALRLGLPCIIHWCFCHLQGCAEKPGRFSCKTGRWIFSLKNALYRMSGIRVMGNICENYDLTDDVHCSWKMLSGSLQEWISKGLCDQVARQIFEQLSLQHMANTLIFT